MLLEIILLRRHLKQSHRNLQYHVIYRYKVFVHLLPEVLVDSFVINLIFIQAKVYSIVIVFYKLRDGRINELLMHLSLSSVVDVHILFL